MATVTQLYADKARRPLVVFDFSPPRSGDASFAEPIAGWDVDLISVAYSPGRAVRMDTVAAAATIKRHGRKDAIFNLSCRDMNKLAVQMHLLGAQALDVENVLAIRGDDFSEKDLALVKPVNDYRTTDLIRDIKQMNEGRDFRGLKLAAPTAFCVGATADLNLDLEVQARLAAQKLEAGADFFITQSVYDPGLVTSFSQRLEAAVGGPVTVPIFYGVQVLVPGGLVFGKVPEAMQRDVARGRSGVEMAIELAQALMDTGCDAFYIVPPILKGGARDYEAAQQVSRAIKRARVGGKAGR